MRGGIGITIASGIDIGIDRLLDTDADSDPDSDSDPGISGQQGQALSYQLASGGPWGTRIVRGCG